MSKLQATKEWFREHFSAAESGWAYRFAYEGVLEGRLPVNFYFPLTPSWLNFYKGESAACNVLRERLRKWIQQ